MMTAWLIAWPVRKPTSPIIERAWQNLKAIEINLPVSLIGKKEPGLRTSKGYGILKAIAKL